MSSKRRAMVREPVQVYLDAPDRELLEQLAEAEGVPRTEVIRYAIRQYGQRRLAEERPGASLDALLGALNDVPALPTDLSVRHDDYLYPPPGGES
jgi:hypothetical protein